MYFTDVQVMNKQINKHTEWSRSVRCLLLTQPRDQLMPTVFLPLPTADVVCPDMITPEYQQTSQPLASSRLVEQTKTSHFKLLAKQMPKANTQYIFNGHLHVTWSNKIS